jgi:hypothetical protein
MRKTALALADVFLLLYRPATAHENAAKLAAVWKLVSLTGQIVGGNAPPSEPLGAQPERLSDLRAGRAHDDAPDIGRPEAGDQ